MIPFDTFGSPNNPSLHFAHANGFPPNVYRQFLNQLGAQYHVTAVHHRPLWDKGEPYESVSDWRIIANDLISFLDSQNAQGIIGVGHSMGGVSTMYAAIERPDLFSKIILIEPVFLPLPFLEMAAENPTMGQHNPMVASALKRRNQWASREEAYERFRTKKVFAAMPDDALWDYVNAATVPNADGITLAYPREWEARFYAMPPLDVWECVGNIPHPTLGIRGNTTDTLHQPAWEMWQAKQPDATFVEVENVGHLLMLEQPAAIADIVLNWLS